MDLIAGYFAGEFGWQLMAWQAKIRHLSQSYDKTIIGCEPQYRYLYEDFCSEFIDFKDDIISRNMWLCNNKITHIDDTILNKYNQRNYVFPCKEVCLNEKYRSTFIKYGEKRYEGFDILIHARNYNNLNTSYRDYPELKWEKVVSLLDNKNIASIGTINDSLHIKGTQDLRGIDLKELCNIMSGSNVLLSPSSGIAHLASLCGLRHIVWSDIKTCGIMNNKDRYLNIWNPLSTPCEFIETWKPTPQQIISKI